MNKVILLDDYFPTGEATVQPVLLYGPGRGHADLSHVTKTASEAIDYIKNVVPEPGKTQALLLALGAEEHYGPNRNGDGFPEKPVRARDGKGYYVAPGQELTRHYQTFETNPAHAFKHHVNKDPRLASGVVKKAFYNPRMHRVELLVSIDNEKDAEWVQRINDGDFPPVSMGCRIKYDVCSRCGNQAPTRAQYCKHAQQTPDGMNHIGPDGIQNYVHNPDPNFFDISRVFRPADRQGYTLKKVAYTYELRSSAELGDELDALERKSAALRKVSDIDKMVRGEPVASASNLGPGDANLIRQFRDYAGPRLGGAPSLPVEQLLAHDPGTVLSTLSAMGIVLTTPEFLRYMVSRLAGRPVDFDQGELESAVAMQAQVFSLLAQSPTLVDEVLGTGVLDERPEKVSATLARTLEPFTQKRAGAGEMLYRRLVPEGAGLRDYEAPRSDLLHYDDPSSNQSFATTRGAAIDASDARSHSDLARMVGGGALLAGGYKALTALPSLRPYKLPLGIAAGAAGLKWLRPGASNNLHTREGLDIPNITELSPEKQATENVAALVVNLLEEYACLSRAKMAHVARRSLVEQVKHARFADSLRGPSYDFDAVAEALGKAIVS